MKINRIIKKMVIVIAIVYLFFFLSIIINIIKDIVNSWNDYTTIEKYVNEDYKNLEKVAKAYIKENKINYSNKLNSNNIIVHSKEESYVKSNNTIVEFSTGGHGFGPSSTYIGFYYSENDIPASFQNGSEKLTKIDENKWEWIGVGDNHGITIKIRKNWYYYEASF